MRLTDGFGHRLIGQQHELLDEFVGIFRGLEVGLDGLAGLVDIEVEFLAVELHRAVLEAGGTEFLGEGIEFDEHLGILALIRIFLCGGRCRLASAVLHAIVLENLLYLLVGIATVALDDGMGQVPFLHVGLVVHLEDNAVTEFFLIRTERTDEVTEALGQHGDGAVDEVDTRGTVVGLLIDGGALFYIVAHVGDMNTNFPQFTI